MSTITELNNQVREVKEELAEKLEKLEDAEFAMMVTQNPDDWTEEDHKEAEEYSSDDVYDLQRDVIRLAGALVELLS